MPSPLAIVYRPLASLIAYARNARTHSPEQVAAIVASIGEFAWTNPVLIRPDGTIIAGHGRVLAAHELHMAEVPCIVLAHLSDAQANALRIADNQLAIAGAAWDENLLRSELGLLQAGGYDVGLLGFSSADLASLFNRGGGLTDPDAAPPLPPVPVSLPGDVWLLGRHRLLCGDATRGEDVALLLGDAVPRLMVTDPPYGVGYDANWRNEAARSGATFGRARGVIGARAIGPVMNDDRADWSAAWALFPGCVAYVWHGGLHAGPVELSLAAAGFLTRAQIVWIKSRPVISRGAYHWQHEPALYAVRGEDDAWNRFEPEHEVAGYAVRKGATANWQGGRRQSTVWFIEHVKSDTGHSTQKPVEAMRRPLENNSRPGDSVYDPFCGSGTTLIAAEMTARVGLGLEIDPGYCDVGVLRWSAFTGQDVRHADGRTFAQVKRARETATRPAKRRKVSA